MIAFAHTKFGLVRIQGSGVKRGGGGAESGPLVWASFSIPVQIGLKADSHDPIFGSDFDSNSKKLLTQIDISLSWNDTGKNRIRKSDRVNQP